MSALATSVASLYGWGFYQVPEASGLKGWQWVILALGIGSFISSGTSCPLQPLIYLAMLIPRSSDMVPLTRLTYESLVGR